MNSEMQSKWQNSYLFGSNVSFIEELYDQYLTNPDSIDPKYRQYFDSLQDEKAKDVAQGLIKDKFIALTEKPVIGGVSGEDNPLQAQVWLLVKAYRILGHLCADLDPLKINNGEKPKELDLKTYGLENALEQEFSVDITNSHVKFKLKDIVNIFENTYCNKVSFEIEYIVDYTKRNWLRNYVENNYLNYKLDASEKVRMLQNLVEAEGWERYLNTKYPGAKRFSLEGGEVLISAFDRLISQSAKLGINEVHVGMAHRGRLNTLVNIAGKPPAKIFAEFEEDYKLDNFVLSGDVKYHKGYKCKYHSPNGAVELVVSYNPSHLETINPVLNGKVRARQDILDTKDEVLGVIIHGDSALIGLGTNQGVLNMSETRAYNVGGMIHIVVNNQVGFTTSDSRDTRSSNYCSDVIKMIDAPIIHVNGDDVESVAFAIDMALDYRMQFKKDIMLDIVCFRRHGHQETDDPTLTQPLMYRLIKQHPGIKKVYADKLVEEQVITSDQVDKMGEEYRLSLNDGVHPHADDLEQINWYETQKLDIDQVKKTKFNDKISTAISKDLIADITKTVTTLPNPDFKLHSTVNRVVETRKLMGVGEKPVDYGMAEMFAYGSLLKEGVCVRLTGEDSGRGTFSHRHAVWHNANRQDSNDLGYIPLKQLENNSKLHIYDSVLNEECVLGFEYGYSTERLNSLVIWEAQFGDFANGGQVIIDQFIASSEAKWGLLSHLVMILPHGYDGQGPEHSSARIERYLQLCAENNLQLVVPSTASQMFHALRRHALSNYMKPMMIFMSKRLLRYPDALSDIKEFTDGEFNLVIPDNATKPSLAKKVILCMGQVYYDLAKARLDAKLDAQIAIIRVEQLYPFPIDAVTRCLKQYTECDEFVWVQEEPYNQGAWMQVHEYLNHALTICFGAKTKRTFTAVSRKSSAAPACGLGSMHKKELEEIISNSIKL